MVYYFGFIWFQCILLTFAFTFGAFKSWPKNFGLDCTDSKFQNFGFDDGESLKVNISVTYSKQASLVRGSRKELGSSGPAAEVVKPENLFDREDVEQPNKYLF